MLGNMCLEGLDNKMIEKYHALPSGRSYIYLFFVSSQFSLVVQETQIFGGLRFRYIVAATLLVWWT